MLNFIKNQQTLLKEGIILKGKRYNKKPDPLNANSFN